MKLKRKIIGLISLFSITATISIPTANADTFSYTRIAGGKFNAWYDSSVSSYGYTPHLDYSRGAWGNISSNVAIGSTTSPSGSSTDEIYVGTTATDGLFGLTVPYVVSWPSNIMAAPAPGAAPNRNWDYAVISIYDNQLNAYGLKTWTGIIHTTTHEMGHSLALAHTTAAGQVGPSVMTAGTYADRSVTNPNSYDQSELKSKWGN